MTDPVWWFFLTWLPDYFKASRGLDIKHSWIHLVTIYAIVTVLSICGRIGERHPHRSGVERDARAQDVDVRRSGICVLPIVFVTRVGDWSAVLLIGLAAASHQAWSANLFTSSSDVFAKKDVAMIVGLGGMAGALGGVLFPWFAGWLLDRFHATGNVTGGYTILFAICASAYLVSFAHSTPAVADVRAAAARRRRGRRGLRTRWTSQTFSRQYDLTGRTAVVTGATGVIGGAISGALAGLGANVIMLGRRLEPAKAIRDRLTPDAAARTVAISADVLDPASLRAALDVVLQRFGPPHVLINNAGGNSPDATTAPERSFFDLPAEALRAVVDLNLLGTVLPSQVFGRPMAERGEGIILNVSSMNAFRPLTRIAGYSAAKAAVSNFTQWLAVHMAQEYSPNIRVNAIAPGFLKTRQNEFLLADKETGELTARGEAILAHTPQRRFGTPEDLLGAVLWLLSPASAFVTGIVVPIDGGFSAFSGV